MPKYEISIKASYYDDIVVEAADAAEARKKAVAKFKPTWDNNISVDIYGGSPWSPDGDPNEEDKYMDEMRGIL